VNDSYSNILPERKKKVSKIESKKPSEKKKVSQIEKKEIDLAKKENDLKSREFKLRMPNSAASKQGYHLLFPHTFADTSVKDLFNNLIYNGADESNIRAILVGGAKLFLDYDMIYQENLDTVKKELQSLKIEI
jgi:hypothetical protein